MGNEMNQCVIIGSAPCESDDAFQEIDWKNSFVICADGGLDHAIQQNITPNLIIGDFDSIQNELPNSIETIQLQIEKDDTDMMAAIRVGLKRGFRNFVLLGALGGRFDHSFANLCALQYLAAQGCKAMIAGQNSRIFLLNGGRLTLSMLKGKTISVFPFGTASCTVTYDGLKYPLTETRLSSDYPLGVSNIILTDDARITVHDGIALIIVLT